MRRSCLWEFLFWTFYSLHSASGWVFSLYFLQSPTFSLCWKHLFPRAAITNHHKVGNLKQPKFVFSQFRRAEVWNQYIRGLMLLLKALEKNSFLPFPSFGGFPTFSLSLTGIHTPISASVSMGPNYMCLCMLAFSLKNIMHQI